MNREPDDYPLITRGEAIAIVVVVILITAVLAALWAGRGL